MSLQPELKLQRQRMAVIGAVAGAVVMFIIVTLLGWSALVGFLIPKYSQPGPSVTAMLFLFRKKRWI